MSAGIIEIRRTGASGFVVGMTPANPLHPERSFTDLRAALSHASGLRLVTGYAKHDLTGA